MVNSLMVKSLKVTSIRLKSHAIHAEPPIPSAPHTSSNVPSQLPCVCVCEHLQVKTGKNKVTQQSPLTLKVHTLELIKTLYLTTFSHIQAPFSQWLFIQTFELPRYQKQAKQTCGQLQNELQLLQNGHLKAIQ